MNQDEFQKGDKVTLEYGGKHNGEPAIVVRRVPHKKTRQKFRVRLVNIENYYMTRWANQLHPFKEVKEEKKYIGVDPGKKTAEQPSKKTGFWNWLFNW